MKGATPVPGPTITMGVEGSFGKWKAFAVRGEMDIWNVKPKVTRVKENLDKRTLSQGGRGRNQVSIPLREASLH